MAALRRSANLALGETLSYMGAMNRSKRPPDPRLADRLRAVRKELGLSAQQMAERLGMSLRTYRTAEFTGAVSHAAAILLALRALERGLDRDE
jgi:DNA-binding XRE family transcriptional regulator